MIKLIAELKAILADEEKVLEIIREELTEIKERFNDKRRTEIVTGGVEIIEDEDLIPRENIVITLTHNGYIKRLQFLPIVLKKEADEVFKEWEQMKMILLNILLTTSTHDTILFFTNKGKVYRSKDMKFQNIVVQLKEYQLLILLEVEKGEWVNAIIPVEEFVDDWYLILYYKRRNF